MRGIGCHGSRVNSVKGLAATQTNGAECQPVAKQSQIKIRRASITTGCATCSMKLSGVRALNRSHSVTTTQQYAPDRQPGSSLRIRALQTLCLSLRSTIRILENARHDPRTIEALLGLPLLLNVARSFSVRDSFSVGKRAVYRNAHHHSLEPNQNDRNRGASKIAGTTNPA